MTEISYKVQQTISDAHAASDIDGHGDEGAGYDYEVFAQELIAAGWTPPNE